MKCTKATIEALRWFELREPVGWFNASAPTVQMRRLLEKRGLIVKIPPTRAIQLIKFHLTAEGRRLLRTENEKSET